MFGFLKRFTQPTHPVQQPSESFNEGIHYDPQLIDTLKSDHQELLTHYKRIAQKTSQGHYREVRAELSHFKTLFHAHILVENVKLYVYLNHSGDIDEEQAVWVKGMRGEMRHIGKAVNQFIEHYDRWPWDKQMEHSFSSELEQIGNALVERIETEEETLYPLYSLSAENA